MTDYDQMRAALAEVLGIEDTGQPWTLLVEEVWAMRQRLAALAADTHTPGANPCIEHGRLVDAVLAADTPPGDRPWANGHQWPCTRFYNTSTESMRCSCAPSDTPPGDCCPTCKSVTASYRTAACSVVPHPWHTQPTEGEGI